MSRKNPCKGREAGCRWKHLLAPPTGAGSRCAVCKAAHNAREAVRRAARRSECQCWVCGGAALRIGGVYQATCAAHVHYRRDVSA